MLRRRDGRDRVELEEAEPPHGLEHRVAEPSRSWARTAMPARFCKADLRGLHGLRSISSCPRLRRGSRGRVRRRGGVVPALVEAGYDALGVDPRAPAGPRYSQVDYRDVEGEFDAVVAGRVLHHMHPLGEGVEQLAALAPLLVVDEFAGDLIDDARAGLVRGAAPDARRGGLRRAPRRSTSGAEHPDLHPHGVVLEALRERYDERALEWVPYFHRWLRGPEQRGARDVADRAGAFPAIGWPGSASGASARPLITSTTRSSRRRGSRRRAARRASAQLARLRQLLDDVGAADELAADEHLRDRRPARQRRQLLPDRRVGKHVDGRHRRAGVAQRVQRAVGVAAHDELRRALHEERDRLVLDDVLDALGELAHGVPRWS